MAYHTLRLEIDGPVAVLRLARPGRGNPIDSAFLRELADVCTTLNDDESVRVTVLTADGDVFSNGWDGERGQADGDPFAPLESMGQPIMCAVNGAAKSAGLELALACDVRIASETATFCLPETALGTLPSAGGTQRLPRIAGQAAALRMVLLGEEIDAEEAYRIGLVSELHPAEELIPAAIRMAQRMASRGPIALRYAKEAVRRGSEQPLDEALQYETDLTIILQATEDRDEGVRAFLEKREPEFHGR